MQFSDIDIVRKYSRQYKYTIRSTDTGPDDTITPHAMTSLIQEAASVDAGVLGFGADDLDARGICWLLLRTSVRFCGNPKWRDEITIDTWTNGTDKLLALRDFCISAGDGKILAKATTSWLLADSISKRPKKITILENRAMTEVNHSILGFTSPRIEELPGLLPEQPTMVKFAGYSEIDRNNHVNNTRYIAWCLDAVALTAGADINITGFDINYISEITIGENVEIFCSVHTAEITLADPLQKAYLVSGRHGSDGRTSFAALFYLK
ncbi:MAG: acyl-[acyl-carrier-protein] thioesterase [Saccharofermentanales bacterium]